MSCVVRLTLILLNLKEQVVLKIKVGQVLVFFLAAVLCSCAESTNDNFRIGEDEIQSGLAIVIPEDSGDRVEFAAGELQKFLGEIFGSQPAIQRTSGSTKGKCILLCIEEPGPDAVLGEQGYSIKTQGNQLVITGGLPLGIVYGVYDFLEDYLDCRWLTPDIQQIPRRDSISLLSIDKTYIPPLSYRAAFNVLTRDTTWNLRQKLNGGNGLHTKDLPYQINWHSLNPYLPVAEYFAEHPEYYALVGGKRTNQGQICFTNPEVRRIVSEAVIKRIEPFKVLSVSQNEGGGYCQCENCQAIAQLEGSQSGPLIDFVNYLAEQVIKEYPDKRILTLAYQWSLDPPAHLKAHPNVIVQLCPIGCAFNHPLTEPINVAFQKQIKSWANKCDTLFIWDYTINFWHLLAPHPNFNVLAPNIRFFLDHKVEGVFEQGNNHTNGGEFLELRSYLTAKVLWNPDIDTDQVIDEFLKAYYGSAAPFIRKYIDHSHELVSDPSFHLGTFNGCTCPSCSENKTIPPHWSPEVIREFVSLFDQAEAAVNFDDELLHRVQCARIPLMYKRISGEYIDLGDGVEHDSAMTHAKLGELIERFETICSRECVLRTCEFDDDDTGTFEVYCKGLNTWYARRQE